jgi:hypothetical protein
MRGKSRKSALFWRKLPSVVNANKTDGERSMIDKIGNSARPATCTVFLLCFLTHACSQSIERSITAHEEEVRLKKEEQDRIAAGRKAKEEVEARQRQAEAEAKARAVAAKAQEEAEKVASEKKRLEEQEERKKKAEEQAKREEEVAKLDVASAPYRPMSADHELQGSKHFLTVKSFGTSTRCISF